MGGGIGMGNTCKPMAVLFQCMTKFTTNKKKKKGKKKKESSPAPQFKSISSSALSLLYGPTLKSMHVYWKNHSFDYTDLCQQRDVSAF